MLRAGRKRRAGADIVGPVENRPSGLLDRVGRHADQRLGADNRASVLYTKVFLTQMDPVGANQGGQIGAIIDDQQRASAVVASGVSSFKIVCVAFIANQRAPCLYELRVSYHSKEQYQAISTTQNEK